MRHSWEHRLKHSRAADDWSAWTVVSNVTVVPESSSTFIGGALPPQPIAMMPTRRRSKTRTVDRPSDETKGTCAGRKSVPEDSTCSPRSPLGEDLCNASASTRPAKAESGTSLVASGASTRPAIFSCSALRRSSEATHGLGMAIGRRSEVCMARMDDGRRSSYIETDSRGPKHQFKGNSRSTEAPAVLHQR